jgi:hypothetical protein
MSEINVELVASLGLDSTEITNVAAEKFGDILASLNDDSVNAATKIRIAQQFNSWTASVADDIKETIPADLKTKIAEVLEVPKI